MNLLVPCLMLLAVLLTVPVQAQADVKPATIFSDNMVLQQGQPVPLWGTATPGEAVTVTFGDQSAHAVADAGGKWMVRLKPLGASAVPADLVVAGKNTVTFKNVLVGEVWVCSGQSNMQFMVDTANNAAQEIAAANEPLLRMFTVGGASTIVPQEATVSGSWQVSSPQTAGSFSAVGYFFARELVQKLHVPVGMINASVGGTRAERWISMEGFKKLPSFRARATEFEREVNAYHADSAKYLSNQAEDVKQFPNRLAAWYKHLDETDPGMKGNWMAPVMNTPNWRTVELPSTYATNPMSSYIGSIWCRREIEIPAAWVGKELELHLGAIDEADDTYVNGTHVGRTWFEVPDYWEVPRVYAVPATSVTSTKVTISVRVLNLLGAIGLFGPAEEMKLVLKGAPETPAIPLTGIWHWTEGLFIAGGDIPQPPVTGGPGGLATDPATLYNGMVHPVIPYGIRGAIWYQGESNADAPEEYHELFAGLISSWRQAWGQGDFPFAFVQLANYLAPQALPVEKGSWAELRDAQTRTLDVPNTMMAVITDVGDAGDIHPRNKQDVGKRLALAALAKTYHQKIPLYSGPMYKSMKQKGDTIRLSFDFAVGLTAKGGHLSGFAIAGVDRVFHAANAHIEGENVIVSSNHVAAPVAVRYNWANNPVDNLYNAAGLPASPFRTDAWEPKDFTVATEGIGASALSSPK